MKITRACDPEGPGLRGLITANVVRGGRVSRGANAFVTITAPSGTRFTSFRWAGEALRRDCGYALQLYADGPGVAAVSIKNVRANERCPLPGRAQAAGYRSRTYSVAGATRIVQRVICVGSSRVRSCSAGGANYIRTYKAVVGIIDVLPPTVGVGADTALARGEWVSGTQPLNYDANDNVGVRVARAFIAGAPVAVQGRSCVLADSSGVYADPIPCVNGPGQLSVDTRRLADGTQPLFVQAEDAAGNVGNSAPVTARIDNTPPARVDVAVQAGEGWRNTNSFAIAWSNPPEGDAAPITAANYKLCPVRGGSCTTGESDGSGISAFSVAVPAPGEWTLVMWRRDAAGNQAQANASVPVTLRYDPDPPRPVFEQSPAGDPTLVSVLVSDDTSGLADGTIEISRAGSGLWQTLATQKQGSRLVARIDDAALPAGTYLLRARAYDQARNEGSTDRRADGQPMVVTLPLRIASTLQAGVVHDMTVRSVVRRRGRRHEIRRHVSVLSRAERVAVGRRVQIAGRLANSDGQGIPGVQIDVFSRTPTSAEQLVAVLQTNAAGGFRYTATASTSRTLRFAYGGSSLILPTQSEVTLLVPGTSSIRASHTRVLNGQAVTFHGRCALPVPAGGKLVELQVLLSGRWQTFRTTNTSQAGGWAISYRFARTRGVQHFEFRAWLEREVGYPFESGSSRSIAVRVRGR
jgi:hypothetical protein